MKTPLVSVIMAVRNNEQYVAEAIQSILNQSYPNFELIIISSFDSSKASVDIIDSFKDHRIIHTRGTLEFAMVSDARNLGLKMARGTYIAWMDSDDISLPHRLSTEVRFMETHPSIDIAGSYAKTFGTKNDIIMKNPTEHGGLKASLLFNASMVNPTTIMRSTSLRATGMRYAEGLKYCEDLDFWTRAIHLCKFSTIPKILLNYRTHDNQATHRDETFQLSLRDSIFQKQLNFLEISEDDPKRLIYSQIRTFTSECENADFLKTAESWFKDIVSLNNQKKVYEDRFLKYVFAEKWLSMCRLSANKIGHKAWTGFWNSETRKWLKLSFRNLVRVFKLYISSHR